MHVEQVASTERGWTESASMPTWLAVAWHCAGWAALLLFLHETVPRIDSIFADFGVELPYATRWALAAFNLLAAYPAILLALCIAGVVVDVLVYRRLLKHGTGATRHAWFWSVMLAPLAIGLLLVFVNLPPVSDLWLELS
jgi:type II secretory pathway component PulF